MNGKWVNDSPRNDNENNPHLQHVPSQIYFPPPTPRADEKFHGNTHVVNSSQDLPIVEMVATPSLHISVPSFQ